MVNPLYQKNITSIKDLNYEELKLVVYIAENLKRQPQFKLLKNKIIASCFFESSTRTRLSFEAAIYRLGGSVVGFSDSSNISINKGETLSDTIRVITSYVDAIIIRHPKEGIAYHSALLSNRVPIINAGDGTNQHPSQTLLDLFTIQETQGRLDNLNIAIVGDLKYGRTVHSLTQALSKFFGNHLFFISPDELSMPADIIQVLNEKSISYTVHVSIEDVLPDLDILYMTRIQKERQNGLRNIRRKPPFILSANMLLSARQNLKILHPLPRCDEISIEVDDTPYAYYFQQASNGIFVRQALLTLLLNPEFII